MYHDTAKTHHQHNIYTIPIKVPTQLTEICYDSPISSLVWVLIIWQLKEPHTFYSAAGVHLYDPQKFLQYLQAGCQTPSCWYGFSCHTGLKSEQLHEIPMNTQHCCGHDRLKANMNQTSLWAKKMEQVQVFVQFFGKLPGVWHRFGIIFIIAVRSHVPAIFLIERPIMWYLSPCQCAVWLGMTMSICFLALERCQMMSL